MEITLFSPLCPGIGSSRFGPVCGLRLLDQACPQGRKGPSGLDGSCLPD